LAGPSISIKKRLLALLLIFTMVVAALVTWIGYIQFVKGEELQKKAFQQQNSRRTISPIRGTIYDRNGKELAISVQVGTITCSPNEIKNNKKPILEVASELAAILDMESEKVYELITKKSQYVVIKKKVDMEVEEEVRRWIKEEKIKGINIDEDSKRYYPNSNLACHVIGFTGTDNQGLMGTEAVLEKYLKGVPGKILSEVDGVGREIPLTSEQRIDAENGLNVVLTIDETIQYLATKTLEKAIADYKVMQGAVCIVMDPRTGDVLALVSKPDFNLNEPFAAPIGIEGIVPEEWNGSTSEAVEILNKTVWRNKAISDTYEPGSTFKSFTSAAALEEGVVTPETITTDMPVEIGGWKIHCWRRGREHGTVTFREGIYNSCNPVFVRAAQQLGVDRFYSYLRAFGFYDKTGIELYGEGTPQFASKPQEIDMAVNSFGQRFTITPIQLATGYTAIINEGKLMKPRLVKELIDSEGNVVKRFEPEVIRTVISKETSDTMRDILEGVVGSEKGTGGNAYVKGYRVAGKTGTSETTDKNVKIASFMGFAPADDPVVSCLVVLFDPKGESHMGGVIAAPTAGKILEDVLNYLQVEKRYTEKDLQLISQDVYVPEVRQMTLDEAVKSLKNKGLKYRIEGEGDNTSTVVEQVPKPNAVIPQDSVVILYTYKPEEEVLVKTPDLSNMSLTDAIDSLERAGLNIRPSGVGNVISQSPEPGTEIPIGTVVDVVFKRIDNVE
jgi:stage V sporulation protein D (sporulation-specific penicillin-binding protein)